MSTTVLDSGPCLNCGTSLAGPFCSSCGQRNIPPYPSTRELVVDAFWELSGWDGRFASTLRALVQRPGMLTCEFLEGRRARYLSPLRLYLLASLAYFVLAAATPDLKVGDRETKSGVNVSTTNRPERVANVASARLKGDQPITAADQAKALNDIERAPGLLRPLLRRVVLDPKGFKRGMVETMPKMLFALLPIFAAIVGLLYRGRKYPEHLYFAIHLHAFLFTALSVTALTKFTRVGALVSTAGAICFLWIPVYATLAFRRVYGGSLGRTLVKEAAIAILYATATLAAFMVTIYWVALMT